MIFLKFLLLFLSLHVSKYYSFNILVDYLFDGPSLPNNCYPTTNGLCNLRSAWNSCILLNDTCVLELPSRSIIYLNIYEYGYLELLNSHNINILGQESNITMEKIPSESGDVPINNADFPFYTGILDDTNSGLQNYVSACTQGIQNNLLYLLYLLLLCYIYYIIFKIGCPGETITFTSCSTTTNEDSVFRLYLNEDEVASNDDFCGVLSQIEYHVTESSCQNFCLRVGCYGSGSCSVNVTAYTGSSIYRFINFVSTSDSINPSLNISNLSINNFGNPAESYAGGSINFEGNASFELTNVYFYNNKATVGGAISIQQNYLESKILNCSFVNNIASANGYDDGLGGAIHLDNVNSFIIENCLFSDNIAVADDGYSAGASIYMDKTVDIQIYNCNFINEYAQYGGSIYMDYYCDNVVISNSIFRNCAASRGGGGMYIYLYNDNLNIAGSTFDSCSTSSNRGGGIYLYKANNYFNIVNSTFNLCYSGFYGGAVAIESSHIDSFISNSTFKSCTSGSNGGALRFGTSNTNFIIENTIFERCYSSSGGAVYIYQYNDNLQMNNVKMIECTANQGGGIRLWQFNNNLIFSNLIAFNCGKISHIYISISL
jgi:hypothetical protein